MKENTNQISAYHEPNSLVNDYYYLTLFGIFTIEKKSFCQTEMVDGGDKGKKN